MTTKNGTTTSIEPTLQDFQAVEREYGPLPSNATDAELMDRYWLALAAMYLRCLVVVNDDERGTKPR